MKSYEIQVFNKYKNKTQFNLRLIPSINIKYNKDFVLYIVFDFLFWEVYFKRETYIINLKKKSK
jgi:hypothetical protein